ncbi:hypothetical protein [Paraburkholderia solisilvae]|uniref:Uncharacterized protein n=1 Tax=Paraburkholderia solisilvae TaxID=624376 RepID=A0A6J5EGV6_9BURK|nr:hypothetical protein [Paraburkholderia solisilvae]CAB3764506.1 hypothetical protein LMG29739_04373 [Paraburkholderia solisilvae]
MTRTTASKDAGIDLLDRLFCNQILVYLVFGSEERGWLQRLATRVQDAVAATGATGLRAQRLQHWTLCLLEIFLAGELFDLAKSVQFEPPPLPASLDRETVDDIRAFQRRYFAAFALAVADEMGDPRDKGVPLEVACELAEEFRDAPCAIRHRLVERVLAIQFQDAPIDVFAWLAETGVVPSAKFRQPGAPAVLAEAIAVRAASLCEFEMLRSYIAGSTRLGRYDGGWAKALLTQLPDHLSNESKERLLEVMQAEERRLCSITLKDRFTVFMEPRWREKGYVTMFFARCHSMTPYVRAALEKQSTALTDIGAAMIAIRKAQNPDKAIYAAEGMQETIADDVCTELRMRGLEVNARTLYRHFSTSLRDHVENLQGYYRLLGRLNTVLPAEYGDIYHYYQVGLTL